MSFILTTRKTLFESWKLPFARTELQALFATMAAAAGLQSARAELAILDDGSMEDLNRQAMGCAGPTNILSFPAHTPVHTACPGGPTSFCAPFSVAGQDDEASAGDGACPSFFLPIRERKEHTPGQESLLSRDTDDPSFLGWLALAPDTFLRECLLYGQEPREHCIRLLAHGFAHLLGHDHGPAMEHLARRLETAAHSLFTTPLRSEAV